MENDQDKFYRTLEFYKELGKKVHIKIITGEDKGYFRNGFILDISLSKRCFVFVDDILGERAYLFEDVDQNIVPFKLKEVEK